MERRMAVAVLGEIVPLSLLPENGSEVRPKITEDREIWLRR